MQILIESSNYGFIEIVKYLIEKGAKDSQNGKFEVMAIKEAEIKANKFFLSFNDNNLLHEFIDSGSYI